ncbi:MAG: glycosyltransferase [Dehalococcoidales bacterium]|nr:glycosyltransferase [Dehalococcoidales bacterium]
MKKVLIIGSIWPLHRRGGARVPGLSRYLGEFGWEPIVLTMPLPSKPELSYRVVEAPFTDMLTWVTRKMVTRPDEGAEKQLAQKVGLGSPNPAAQFILRYLRDIVTYPDLNKGWQRAAIKRGKELISNEKIDALISASPPVLANIIAHNLKDKYHLPWLADLPHLWSQNNSYPYSELRRRFDWRLEKRTFAAVDVMTTTAEPLAAKLRSLHPAKPVYAVTHGFDPDTLNLPPARLTDNFTITYTGSFAPVKREPAMLFAALQKLFTDGAMAREQVEVRCYGLPEAWVEEEAAKYNLTGVIRQCGRVSMADAQARQRDSQVLFNPKWHNPQEPGIHSMKIFEYLAARRPILATGPYSDVVDELLAETGAGVCARTVEETAQALEAMYREYLAKGEVTWRGDDAKIGRYSHRAMAGKFAEILNQLTAK